MEIDQVPCLGVPQANRLHPAGVSLAHTGEQAEHGVVWADCEAIGQQTGVDRLDSDHQETRLSRGITRSTTEEAIRRTTDEIVPRLTTPTTISQRSRKGSQGVIIKVLQTLMGLVHAQVTIAFPPIGPGGKD